MSVENDFKIKRGAGFTRIATKDGGPGEVTVEHIDGGWGGEDGGVSLALDFAPHLNGDKRGQYKAVYLTPREARQIAVAMLTVAELPACALADKPALVSGKGEG